LGERVTPGSERPKTDDPAQGRAPIPQRGPLDLKRAKTDLIIGLHVVLAIGLLLLVVIFVPRPDVRITNARFDASACNRVTSTSVVTAYVTLTNTGGADGSVFVRLYVDGERRTSQEFAVGARTSVNQTLSVPIPDCSSHLYQVDTCAPRTRQVTC
jgi:hypothetical protein